MAKSNKLRDGKNKKLHSKLIKQKKVQEQHVKLARKERLKEIVKQRNEEK